MPPAGTGSVKNPSSATYKSIVAYDGTLFEGSQRQAEGHRTVQAELEAALQRMGWQGESLLLAGRTDQGVHASGQVVSFRLDWKHSLADLTAALNANLPPDIAIRKSEQVGDEFHPRFSARSRRYRYSLWLDPLRDPLQERYAWRIDGDVEIAPMQTAAELMRGKHDFVAFGSAPMQGGRTTRDVLDATWNKSGRSLWFEIEADAFLYHMVRRMVAALVEIGQGRKFVEDVERMLDDPSLLWQGLAPAHGLCLTEVRYD